LEFFEELKDEKCPEPVCPAVTQEDCKSFGQYFFEINKDQCPKRFIDQCEFTSYDQSELKTKLDDAESKLKTTKDEATKSDDESKSFYTKFFQQQTKVGELNTDLKLCKINTEYCNGGTDADQTIKKL